MSKPSLFFSDWIRIDDDTNSETIANYPYEGGVSENILRPHCWKCITVNHCWFVDEVDKKPKEFDYSKYISGENPISDTDGLYHPNCHCEEIPIRNPQPLEIKLIETQGKIGYMWKSKLHLYHLWGIC